MLRPSASGRYQVPHCATSQPANWWCQDHQFHREPAVCGLWASFGSELQGAPCAVFPLLVVWWATLSAYCSRS